MPIVGRCPMISPTVEMNSVGSEFPLTVSGKGDSRREAPVASKWSAARLALENGFPNERVTRSLE